MNPRLPVTPKSHSSKRPLSSPEQTSREEKINRLEATTSDPSITMPPPTSIPATNPELASLVEALRAALLPDFCKSLEDAKNEIKNDLKKLKSDYEVEMTALKAENEELRRHLNVIDRRLCQNNLVVRGLDLAEGSNLICKVGEFLKNTLQVDIDTRLLSVRPLEDKRAKKKMLLLKFLREEDKWIVLRNSSKLKNTGIFIDQDYPRDIRIRRGLLLQTRKEIKKMSPDVNVMLRGECLVIKDKRYFWCSINGLIAGNKPGIPILRNDLGIDLSDFINRLKSGVDVS
ncbi:hypothetical protein GE061_012062 [Apolygus lucorum]|uniref:Uncharacterized protein n=1 Tax=Apolygus lucorum TaxID=248454 RepID=A0A8S9XSK5_APOLU|nr:hypothetical protein GE061_012062 [Apolygus lucorum]